MKGIGIDIIEIERIKNAVMRREKFLQRVFTTKEIYYFDQNNYKSNVIAGNFAAKEAVTKALGIGLRGFKWIDIEICRDDLGKPFVCLYNNAKKIAAQKQMNEIYISISHSRYYAVAQAVAV